MVRKLNEWAESHQGRFGRKSVQHRLTETDMGIVHIETLQAGSDIEEFRKFLDQLGARANMRETEDALPLWIIQQGLGCALLSMCWAGGQLGYKGFQTILGNEDDPEPVKLCNASRRGRSVLRREQRKRELEYHWEEPDDAGQREVDSGEGRDVWEDESAELDVSIDIGVEDGGKELETDAICTDPQLEGRKRPRRT